MTTLNEMIEIIRAENVDGLRVGDEEQGYRTLNADESEVTIIEWAKARLEKQAKLAEAKAVIEAKKQAIVKLTELGLDPKAFDLKVENFTQTATRDEA
jgi:hypothetical protein